MKWSRLRKLVESLFADSVQKRVAVHITQFRTCPHRCGHGWITIDGEEVLSASTHAAIHAYYSEAHRLLEEAGRSEIVHGLDVNAPLEEEYVLDDARFLSGTGRVADARIKARQILIERGIFTEGDFCDALRWYADAPIDEILASKNPIVRALAMVDRRVGKRRLRAFDPENEHPLVKKMLSFRLEAEGMEQ